MKQEYTARPLPAVILISGTGSNLLAIIKAVEQGTLPLDIRAVISNRPQASGLQHAQAAGIAVNVLDHKAFTERSGFDHALRLLIDSYHPALVVLAGYMRILSSDFVTHYRGRLLNIHPSLLPAFPGLNTHERALAAGVHEHGASVHFVTHEVDGGPVIIQARVPVLAGDTPATLAQRVLAQEHIIYPRALTWFAQGRLRLEEKSGEAYAILDGQRLTPPFTA